MKDPFASPTHIPGVGKPTKGKKRAKKGNGLFGKSDIKALTGDIRKVKTTTLTETPSKKGMEVVRKAFGFK